MINRRLKSVSFAFVLGVLVYSSLFAETTAPADSKSGPETNVVSQQSQKLLERIQDAEKVLRDRFYDSGTHQFYMVEPARLPSVERIKKIDPNDCGYGTGMDDVPLFQGILLAGICDQYEATRDESLKEEAVSMAKGLQLCATAHGIPGFVARGVSPEDKKSVYITSSRDQYTHLIHGLWRYYRSPLCDEADKAPIREILQAIADRMTRNVTKENGYDFLRADGSRDTRGICRMLDVMPHEAARLAMFYAASWDVSKNKEHYRLYREHLPRAIRESLEMPNLPDQEIARWIPPYSVLQMQCSLEVLHELETDPKMKARIEETMLMVAKFTARKKSSVHRHCGELALAQLMSADFVFTKQHEATLAGAIKQANYDADPAAAYCLIGAYWKARCNGLFGVENSDTLQKLTESPKSP